MAALSKHGSALSLSRAITLCTQPYTQLSGGVLRTLQKFLDDPHNLDNVYYMLVDRALAEPISVAVATKVIAILKQLLLQYPPSQSVLATLSTFCSHLPAVIKLPQTDVKALQYVGWCVARLEAAVPGGRTSHQPRSPVRTAGLVRLMQGAHASGARQPNTFQPLPTVQSGPFSHGGGTSVTSGETPMSRLASLRQPAGSMPGNGLSVAQGAHGNTDVMPDLAFFGGDQMQILPLPYDAGIHPTWAVQPPAMLQELMAPFTAGLGAKSFGVDMRWIAYVPELNPSLSPAPYNQHTLHPSEDASPHGPAAPISVAALLSCVLDLSPGEQPVQLEQVAARLMAEFRHDNTYDMAEADDPSKGKAGLKGAAAGRLQGPNPIKPNRQRLLFHHPPYLNAEPLHMNEADIAVVVEVVCGAAAAHALLSPVQEENMRGARPSLSGGSASRPSQGGGPASDPTSNNATRSTSGSGAGNTTWEDEFDNGDLGQVCMSILIKLIIDMWIAAGPGNSYVLVLRMLRKALDSHNIQIRAHVFDLLYNLSVHACLLEPMVPPPDAFKNIAWDNPPASSIPSQSQSRSQSQTPSVRASQDGRVSPLSVRRMSNSNQVASNPAPSSNQGLETAKHSVEPSLTPIEEQTQPNANTDGEATVTPQVNVDAADGASPPPGVQCQQLRAWIRALLFQLLSDMSQAGEGSDKVWQAALGALLQMCSHGGYWVGAYVEALPLAGLVGLLRACLAFRWAPDIHSHLLRLASVLLIQSDNQSQSDTSESVVDSAADMDNPAPGSSRPARESDGTGESRVLRIPTSFGGLQGVLEALAHAPSPAACMDMLTVLIHFLTPDDETELALTRVLASRGALLFSIALQNALRAPRNGMALRLSAALSGIGPAPQNDATSSSSGLAATMRALGQTPLPSTPSAAAMQEGASILPPHSAKLVLNMLSIVENEACRFRKVFQQSSHLKAYLNATVNHIVPTMGSHTESISSNANAAAAWAELKATCSAVGLNTTTAGTVRSASQPGNTPLGLPTHSHPPPASHHLRSVSMYATPLGAENSFTSGSNVLLSAGHNDSAQRRTMRRSGKSMGGRGDDDGLRTSLVILSPPTTVCSGRQVALHWLFKVLLQALHTCQGNILLLTPLNLRTSEAGKVSMSSAHHHGPGTPAGHHHKNLLASNSSLHGIEAPSPRGSSWTSHLADVLLHCVREVEGGCRLLVAAMSRAVADVKQGVQEAGARHHLVMNAFYIALLWVLQSGDTTPGSDSHLAAQELADQVLSSITQQHSIMTDTPAAGVIAASNSNSFAGSAFLRTRISANAKPDMPGQLGAAANPSLLASQNLHVSTALLVGHADFALEPLHATAPEFLVALVRSCAMQRSKAQSLLRGLYGRPNATSAQQTSPNGALDPVIPASCRTTQSGLPTEQPIPATLQDAATAPIGTAGTAVAASMQTVWEDVAQDRRLALFMALMARCTLDPDAFAKYGLSHLIKEALLPSEDARERYYAGVYLLRHWQLNQQDKYWRMLRQLVLQAQQYNDDSLLDNPYLTVVHMLSVEGHG